MNKILGATQYSDAACATTHDFMPSPLSLLHCVTSYFYSLLVSGSFSFQTLQCNSDQEVLEVDSDQDSSLAWRSCSRFRLLLKRTQAILMDSLLYESQHAVVVNGLRGGLACSHVDLRF